MASGYLNLFCSRCGAHIVRYRKEGSGSLIRLYLDRIAGPETLTQLKSAGKKSGLPSLTCRGCGNLIGVPMVHEGKRLAFRTVKGSFRRKKEDA